jgi:hypothetical protein
MPEQRAARVGRVVRRLCCQKTDQSGRPGFAVAGLVSWSWMYPSPYRWTKYPTGVPSRSVVPVKLCDWAIVNMPLVEAARAEFGA